MSKKKGGFVELLYKTIMPKVYGIGAAVVIIGALFKILHYEGADQMLFIGLTTEAVIFFLSAFEPPHQEPDWSKVYPELGEDYEAPAVPTRISNNPCASLTHHLDVSLEKSNTEPELVDRLCNTLTNLTESAKKTTKMCYYADATS